MRDTVIESLKKKDSGTTGKGMGRAQRNPRRRRGALFAARGLCRAVHARRGGGNGVSA
jgi:adenylosuccinate synthase